MMTNKQLNNNQSLPFMIVDRVSTISRTAGIMISYEVVAMLQDQLGLNPSSELFSNFPSRPTTLCTKTASFVSPKGNQNELRMQNHFDAK